MHQTASVFRLFFMWVGALVWHVFRAATLRPAFKQLADSRIVLVTFLVLYYFTGIVRWTLVNPAVPDGGALASIFGNGLGLTIHAIFLAVISRPTKQSVSLFAVFMAVSAFVDLLVSFGFMIGALDSIKGLHWAIIENVMYLICWLQFRKEPKDVRAAGYRASKTAVQG